MLDLGIDIFNHHDGIVNHKSDGKHNGKESKDIYCESCNVHDKECADKCNGNGDDRNEGCSPVSEEEEDHQYNKQEGNKYGMLDLLYRFPYINGIVKKYFCNNIFREVFFQLSSTILALSTMSM